MNQFNITPGTIFYSSWGYEQTNVSFYQVVKLSGKASVIIREIWVKLQKRGKCELDTQIFNTDVHSTGVVQYFLMKYNPCYSSKTVVV